MKMVISKENKIIKKPTKKNKKPEVYKPKIIQLEKNSDVNIRYIVHLADIHIRKKEREEEYREVFNNLYENIKRKNINNHNSLIVVCGDILHDKSDLHPVSVKLTKDFFIMLCKITTTIVIPGNHDVSLLNQDHNSLESILKNLETEHKLFLLNDEGYYEYNNILFGHTRFGFSKSVLKCDLDFEGYKIGLYHGIVTGGKDNNFNFKTLDGEKKYFSVDDFADYDFTFLGDIHKHSFLKKNIAYPGSLIQQTIDESLDKGYIFWHLEKGKGTFNKIHNDYGKIKIEIDEDGESCYDISKFPKKLDIRIDSKSLDRKYMDDIYKKLHDNNIVINKKIDLMIGSANKDTKILIDGKDVNLNVIKNTNDLSNLLLLKLKENKQIYEKQITNYKKVIDELLQNYNFNDQETKRKIKLISLEFNNMAIYGENNSIDFTKFKHVMGINGPNSSGKSSFIDIILYSIFEKSTRGDRFDMLNINKKSFKSKIVLDINNIKYTIVRSLARNSKINKDVKTELYLYENNKNISGKNKIETAKILEEKIGNIDDFIIASVVPQKSLFQNKPIGFAEFSPDMKRDILCRIARLDIFDNLLTDTTSKLRSLKLELSKQNNKLKNHNEYGNDIINIRLNIDKKKEEVNRVISELELENKILNEKMEDFKKIKYQLSNYDFTKLNDENIDVELIIETISELKNKIQKINKKIKTLKDEINEIGDIKQIEKNYTSKKTSLIQKYNNEINLLTKKLWSDTSINYDKFDKKRNDLEIKKLNDEKINLKNRLESNEELLSEIKKVLTKKLKIIDKKKVDEYNKLNDELEIIKDKKEKNQDELEDYKSRLDNLGEHEFDPKCKFCMKNSITKEKLLLENSIQLMTNNIKDCDMKIKKISQELKKKKKIVEEYEKYLEDKENKDEKENEQKLVIKDNQIYNEKIKNLNIKIKELEKLKENYDKFLENETIEEKIDEIKVKIVGLQDDVCEEKIRYDEIMDEINNKNQELEKLSNKLDNEEQKYKKYMNNKELYEKHELYNKNEKDIEDLQDRIKTCLDKIKDKNNEFNRIENNNCVITVIENEIKEVTQLYDNYTVINDMLKNGGLIESIMKDNLLPRFNQIVNNLFIKFNSRPVEIKYEKSGDKDSKYEINIYNNNQNTIRDGGYQTFLNNLVYRIALLELNPNMKPNFMIIDEAFDSADNNNKQEMKKLISYLRSQYDWVIIVSHDEDIKDAFDNIIEITETKGNMKNIIY